MKRYTLSFCFSDHSITPDKLKEEVESVLLRLHPRITYKLGQVTLGEESLAYVQVALDGNLELLKSTLKERDWKIPIRFEGISWGWSIANAELASTSSALSSYDSDPLSAISPIEENGEFPLSKRRLWGRYIVLIASTSLVLVLLTANALHPNSPLLEWIYVLVFFIWLICLSDTPIDYRIYAQKITLDQAGIEITYWQSSHPTYLAWERILGMEYSEPVCTLLSNGNKTRFLVSERFGSKDKSLILKTIIIRSELCFVEGNPRSLIYRRGTFISGD